MAKAMEIGCDPWVNLLFFTKETDHVKDNFPGSRRIKKLSPMVPAF